MPSIELNALNNQTVGQPLTLKCSVFTVRGVTSTVDIIWKHNGLELESNKNINVSATNNNLMLFVDNYTISQLSTADEDKTYHCDVLINAMSPIIIYDNITLNVTGKCNVYNTTMLVYACTYIVPYIHVTAWPTSHIQGAMVGSPQDIQCIVSTVSGVELSSVMISWMGPGGESITNDSRVTISPTTSSGNNYTSSLQFTYLMEGDEGMYTCNVMILETSSSIVVQLIKPIGKPASMYM